MKNALFLSGILYSGCVLSAYAAVVPPVGPKPAHKHATDDLYYDVGGVQLFNDEPMKDDGQNSCPWAVYLPKDSSDLTGFDYPNKICHGSNHEGWYTYLVYDVLNKVFITSNRDPAIYNSAAPVEALLTEENYESNADFIVVKMFLIETDKSSDIYVDEFGNAITDEFGVPLPRWNQLPRYKLGGPSPDSDDQDLDGFRDTYTFGSPPSEPGHQANEEEFTIATGDLPAKFWMAELECSQALFTALCSRVTLNQAGGVTELEKNSAHNGPGFVDYAVEYSDIDFSRYRAMNYVSWNDINDPVDGFMKAFNDAVVSAAPATSERFRLPNEFEWEYACRMGQTTAFNTGYSISSAGTWDTDGVTYNLSTFTVEEDETWERTGVILGADNSVIDPAGKTDFAMKITMELDVSGEATVYSQANFDGRYRRWYTPILTFQYDNVKEAFVQHFTSDLTIEKNAINNLDPSIGSVGLANKTITINDVEEDKERIFFDENHFRKSITGLHMAVDARGRWQTSIIEADGVFLPNDVDNVSGADNYVTDAKVRPIERFVALSDSLIPSSDNASNPFLSSGAASPLLKPSNVQTASALIYYKEAEYDAEGLFNNSTGPLVIDSDDFLGPIMDLPLSKDELNLVNFDNISMNDLIQRVVDEVRNGLKEQWTSTGGITGGGPVLPDWPPLPSDGKSLLAEVADGGFKVEDYKYMQGSTWSIDYYVGRPGTYTKKYSKDPSPPANAKGDQRGRAWWDNFDFDDGGPLDPGEGFYLRRQYPDSGKGVQYHDRLGLLSDSSLLVKAKSEPSLWLLADMHGNLSEFCIPGDYTSTNYRWDGSKTYAAIEADQASASDDSTSLTVPVRGGHWRSNADGIRSARRDAIRVDKRYSTSGFRFMIPAGNLRYASDDVVTYTTPVARP